MKTPKLISATSHLAILSILFMLIGCISISNFDQYAYTNTTILKVDAMSIMDLSSVDYETHQRDVQNLRNDIQKLYEYEKNRPKNEITLQLWDKLMNKDGHLLGGFLKKWEDDSQLNETFINESKKLVGNAFDQIAQLESKKIKKSEINN